MRLNTSNESESCGIDTEMGRLLFLPEALLRPFHIGESALRRILEDFPLIKHTLGQGHGLTWTHFDHFYYLFLLGALSKTT